MKIRSLVAVVFCMSFASLAFANMAFRQVVTYPLVIEVSPDATQPKLIIPTKCLTPWIRRAIPRPSRARSACIPLSPGGPSHRFGLRRVVASPSAPG